MDDVSLRRTYHQVRSLETRSGPISGPWPNTFGLCAILAVGYFALGRLTFALAASEPGATSVAFLPEGLALAFAILFGSRIWPGILVGQFFLSVSLGLPSSVGLAFGAINSLENICGGLLFWKWRMSLGFLRAPDVLRFFGLISLILQPLGTLAKVPIRAWIADFDYALTFDQSLYAWSGNTIGQFLMATLLLSWSTTSPRIRKSEIWRALSLVSLYLLVIFLFLKGEWGQQRELFWLSIFAGFYITLISVAVQSSLRTMSLANLLMTAGFFWMTSASPGTLFYFSAQDRILYTNAFIIGGVVSAFLVSALLSQLKLRTEQLAQANNAKETIFHVIGHDLRSPIVNLKASLDMMEDGSLSSQKFLEFRSNLRKAVDHAHWTLENLMEWGASQKESLHLRSRGISLLTAVEESIQLLSHQAKTKKIQIDNLVPPDAFVYTDSHQLSSTLRNLLTNGLKFTPEGGRLTLQARPDRAFWCLSIRDNGIGMSEDFVANLFKVGHQSLSTPGTANERGLGLGLQICLDFVQANHGTLTVESTPGRGTTVHVRLPMAHRPT